MSSPTSASRERLLDRVEDLLFQHRPEHLSMREIAQHLGMKAASLYYHAEGKEDLFRQVIRRSIQRNEEDLRRVIDSCDEDVDRTLVAIGDWFLQPSPMNLIHTIREDVSKMNRELSTELSRETHAALIRPVEAVFVQFQEQGKLRIVSAELLAGSFLSILDGIWYATSYHVPKELGPGMVREMVDVLLRGLYDRDGAS